MKKSFLLLIAAALLAACSSNEMAVELKEKPIGFSRVYIDKSTKAIRKGPYTTDNFEYVGNTFGVFGYKTTETQMNAQVFNNVKVEYKNGLSSPPYEGTTDWAYSPLVYWDKTASNYKFFAYAPHSGDFTNTGVTFDINNANSFKINDFEQALTVNDQIDLMTDLTNQNNVTGANIGDNDVKFTFGHILSNINVTMAVSSALKADETDNPVSVVEVTLGTIKMKGSYAYNTDSTKYKWALAEPSTTKTFSATQSSGNVFASKALTATPAEVPGLTGMLMIPQKDVGTYQIYVKYKIKDEVFERTIALSAFKKDVTKILAAWEPGYQYTYNIVIGPTPILFDMNTVSGWAPGGIYTYTVE
ncbi:MAG: hypothetical protein BWY95_00712 [Bacteroidetes bacterium ADurb.BinA104]|jgi:hypothetical protein|nr:MAG: hypothetical protein BWY95_00712 [Bacteroidetes bacterium ADurb.BinA104]